MKHLYFLLSTTLLMLSQTTWGISKATEVVEFEVSESMFVVKGKCWTESVATSRPNAWRCMVDSGIYDPCFSTSSPHMVICDLDPAHHRTGLTVQLTEPLPTSSQRVTKNIQPFQIRLTDGSVCAPFTGTRVAVGQDIVTYGCQSPECPTPEDCQVGIISIDQKKPQWIAQVVIYKRLNHTKQPNKESIQVKKVQKIAVETAWQ